MAYAAHRPDIPPACRAVPGPGRRPRGLAAHRAVGYLPLRHSVLCSQAPDTVWYPPPGRWTPAASAPHGLGPAALRSAADGGRRARPLAVIHARRADLHHGAGLTRHAAVAAVTVAHGRSTATRLFVREGPEAMDEDAVVLDAFTHLYRRAERLGERLSVHVTHSALSRELSTVASSFPAVELAPAATGRLAELALTASTAISGSIRRIDDDLHRLAVARAGSAPPLHVATDASKRFRGRALGIAYVTEDGRHRQSVVAHARPVLHGELSAIAMAVTDLRHRDLHIVTDSLLAVRALAVSPECASKRHGPAVGALVRRIHRAAEHRDVRYRWVRGHSGHALNEIADRLAVASRRGHEAGLTRDELAGIARRIVEDLRTPVPADAAGGPHRDGHALAAG